MTSISIVIVLLQLHLNRAVIHWFQMLLDSECILAYQENAEF